MKPFFSIIIPTLNEEKYIPLLLDCLHKQRSQNFEAIVVDGCSQDKTRSIVQSYRSHLPIRFTRLTKGNLSMQKNRGAQIATCDNLIFLDADMLIGPQFTKRAEIEIRKRKGFVFVPYVFPIEKKEYPEVHTAMIFFNKLVELSLDTGKPFSAGPAQLWNRNVFLKINGFDDIFGEDHHIIRKAQDWGIHVRQISNLKVQFSLRRLKKEGRIKIFSHFISANISLLFQNKQAKRFAYTMGGQFYEEKRKEINHLTKLNPHQVFININKKIQSFIRDLKV